MKTEFLIKRGCLAYHLGLLSALENLNVAMSKAVLICSDRAKMVH